jgi:hypothetical protein
MRGSLRIHSPIAVILLMGWSLLAHARERVASTRMTPRAEPPPIRENQATDPKLWN